MFYLNLKPIIRKAKFIIIASFLLVSSSISFRISVPIMKHFPLSFCLDAKGPKSQGASNASSRMPYAGSLLRRAHAPFLVKLGQW